MSKGNKQGAFITPTTISIPPPVQYRTEMVERPVVVYERCLYPSMESLSWLSIHAPWLAGTHVMVEQFDVSARPTLNIYPKQITHQQRTVAHTNKSFVPSDTVISRRAVVLAFHTTCICIVYSLPFAVTTCCTRLLTCIVPIFVPMQAFGLNACAASSLVLINILIPIWVAFLPLYTQVGMYQVWIYNVVAYVAIEWMVPPDEVDAGLSIMLAVLTMRMRHTQ